MSKYCTNCGTEVSDELTNCNLCGAPLADAAPVQETPAQPVEPAQPVDQAPPQAYAAPQADPNAQYQAPYAPAGAAYGYAYQPDPNQPYAYQPQYYAPPVQEQPVVEEKKKREREPGEVSVAAFFWLRLVFGIPVVGLIVSLILAFAAKRWSLKNYARANLVWVLVGLGISIILAILYAVCRVNNIDIIQNLINMADQAYSGL